jgi:hypothetical protein
MIIRSYLLVHSIVAFNALRVMCPESLTTYSQPLLWHLGHLFLYILFKPLLCHLAYMYHIFFIWQREMMKRKTMVPPCLRLDKRQCCPHRLLFIWKRYLNLPKASWAPLLCTFWQNGRLYPSLSWTNYELLFHSLPFMASYIVARIYKALLYMNQRQELTCYQMTDMNKSLQTFLTW